MASKRHARANNSLVEGYDPGQPSSHILYLDANNLYGWAMSQYLPTGGFRWVDDCQQLVKTIAEQPADSPEGYILEVDLEYPEDLSSATCELYHHYGMFLAPLTAALHTLKHCQFGHCCLVRVHDGGDEAGEPRDGGGASTVLQWKELRRKLRIQKKVAAGRAGAAARKAKQEERLLEQLRASKVSFRPPPPPPPPAGDGTSANIPPKEAAAVFQTEHREGLTNWTPWVVGACLAGNSYPLAPERMVVQKEWMSEYQHNLLGVGVAPTEVEKLVTNLRNKDRYVLHYRNLQLYMSLGMRLTKVHRALRFDQSPWMEPYIQMNTELWKKAASGFEKDLYKLMNNSVFGKTMENLRRRVDMKLVRSNEEDKLRRLIASPAFARATIFDDDDGSYPGPQEPPRAQSPGVREDEHSGFLQAPDVRLLLQLAPGAVRGSLSAPLRRHRQPSPRGPDRGCLQGHGLPRRALRHIRLPVGAPTAQLRQQKGVGEDEGRVCRAPQCRIYRSAP